MHRRRNTKDDNGKFFILKDDDNEKRGGHGKKNQKNRCGLFIVLGVLANLAVFLMVKKRRSNKNGVKNIPQQPPLAKEVSVSDPAVAAGDAQQQLRATPESDVVTPKPKTNHQPAQQPPRIPRRLIFTYKYKLIAPSEEDPKLDPSDPLTANVLSTIDKYTKYWAKNKHVVRENTEISFLTDKDCLDRIRKAERRLVRHWTLERRGEFKADLCRAAELYLNGGYYFDIDIKAIEPVNLDNVYASSAPIPEGRAQLRSMKGGAPPLKVGKDDIVTFATTYRNGKFFNGFTAATPGHPVLKKSLEYLVAFYDGTLSTVLPESILNEHRGDLGDDNPLPSRSRPYGHTAGAYTLQAAYRTTTDEEWKEHAQMLMKEKGYSPENEQEKSYEVIPPNRRYSRFLYEISLEDEGLKQMDMFQDIPLQDADYEKKRKYCNFVCFAGSTPYFYTRAPGSRGCPLDGTEEMYIPPSLTDGGGYY